MAAYLAMRIMDEKLDYSVVLSKAWGKYKEDVDLILLAEGKQDLIKGDE